MCELLLLFSATARHRFTSDFVVISLSSPAAILLAEWCTVAITDTIRSCI